LYELDVTQHDFAEVIERVVEAPFLPDSDADEPTLLEQTNLKIAIPEEARHDQAELRRQVQGLVMNVINNVDEIDAILQEAAPALPISQIAVVDRNALRIGLYQLLYDESVPDFAAINEAVELATGFGGERSAAFVNGVLRTVQQNRRGQAAANHPATEGQPPHDESSDPRSTT
jgi:transcription antitermination factor NusB